MSKGGYGILFSCYHCGKSGVCDGGSLRRHRHTHTCNPILEFSSTLIFTAASIILITQEEFLKDVMQFLILRGHTRLIPQGGIAEFPDAILNAKRLDLFNLYREVSYFACSCCFSN